MPVPKRRRSSTKKGMMRAHKNLTAPGSQICPNCSARKTPHRICPECGQYKDRVYDVKVTQ